MTPAVGLAVQLRLICDDEVAVAARPVGALGGGVACVVAVATFDGLDEPAEETATTVKLYAVLGVSPVTE